MANISKKDVAILMVTYNSNIDKLGRIIRALNVNSDIYIVDNSDNIEIKNYIIKIKNNINLIINNNNIGIAAAQNLGLKKIIESERNYSFVILMDDDSLPPIDFVDNLVCSYKLLAAVDPNIAAICARPYVQSSSLPASSLDMSNVAVNEKDPFSSCERLNSSGSLIPINVFHNVGLMDESLFIDLVDFDWGFRAQKLGLKIYICRDIKFSHSLGDSSWKLGPFIISKGSPLRGYYQFRNVILLLKRSYVPLNFKIYSLISLPLKFVLYIIFFEDKVNRVKFLILGTVHGLFNKTGKYCGN